MRVQVVDAGVGNLRSLGNALTACGFDHDVRREPSGPLPDAIILPGVGAFGHAAKLLADVGWTDRLREARDAGVRIVGICLGMQLLYEASEESPGARGLGFLPGRVRRLDSSLAKVPHMSWARLNYAGPEDAGRPGWAYFVHSYAAAPSDPSSVAATAVHPEAFPAVVARGNVVGVQFHPEKSQTPGVRYLKRLVEGLP